VGEPLVLRAGEGELVTDRPERTLRILTDHELLNLTWFRYEPGEEGPDPHVHYTHSDAFYILEGEIELRLGPKVESVPAPAGTLGAAPPNLVHTFRNSSDSTALFLNIHAPGAGFADMMRARRDGRDEEADRFDQHDPPADGGRPLTDAVVATPDQEGARDTDGHFSLAKAELPPASRKPVRGLAAVYVLEGTIALDETELAAGDFALVTNGDHNLGNPTGGPSRYVILEA
jgi:mannose-6-phosphate isomerase-like protein (cupin superfamily)